MGTTVPVSALQPGIAGWLKTFVVIQFLCGVQYVLLGLWSISDALRGIPDSAQHGLLMVIVGGFTLFAAFMLTKREPAAIKMAKIAVVAYAIVGLLSAWRANNIGLAIWHVFLGLGFWMYLSMSKRVAITFPEIKAAPAAP